jgi:hypothetical protein
MDNMNMDTTVPEKVKGKRRTKEEIAKANAEKQQLRDQKKQEQDKKKEEKEKQKQEKELKKQQDSTPLQPGVGINALAAMLIFSKCAAEAEKTYNAFRRMIASRILFPPKKNINKFMTGGCAEEILSQLIASVGFASDNVSDEATVIDLDVTVPISPDLEHSFKVSLKNSCDVKLSPILENYRGKKRDEIRPLPPTFIIYTEVVKKCVRIVYLDDEIIRQAYPTFSKDELDDVVFKNDDSSLTFKSGFLKNFIPRLPAEYVLNCPYPEDLSFCSEQNIVLLALAEVDRQLGLK